MHTTPVQRCRRWDFPPALIFFAKLKFLGYGGSVANTSHEITLLLEGTRTPEVEEHIFRLVRDRFDAIARGLLHQDRLQVSLDATMLVDSAFVELIRQEDLSFESREQFFGQAAFLMRRLLVDRARLHLAEKRGGGKRPQQLTGTLPDSTRNAPEDLLMLDEALQGLEDHHPDVFRVFVLHYFLQYQLKEISDSILKIPYITVRRRWTLARAFLKRALTEGEE